MNAEKKRSGLPRAAFFLLALFLAVSLPSPVFAQSAQRREFAAAASGFPAGRGASLEDTGTWQEVINRAVFSVFRGAELYRSGISIRLVEEKGVSARFLPSGVFELSAGLLDFIDSSILDSGDVSSRRLRQLDRERERRLLPFIAAEAGIFAADAEFRAYRRIASESGAAAARAAASGAASLSFNMEETLAADICAEAALHAAGEFSSYREWLKSIFLDNAGTLELKGYIARFPEYRVRAAALEKELSDPVNGVQQLKLILGSLKTGLNTADALVAAENLGNKLPGAVYIDRLKALLSHKAWQEAMAENADEIGAALSMLPFSQPLEGERTHGLKIQAERIEGGQLLFDVLPRVRADESARSERLYRQALDSYNRVEAAYSDFAIKSARAFLAARRASGDELSRIVATAAEAALEEAGTSSILARTNYARLLFLTGQDIPLSVRIMEEIFPQGEETALQGAGKEALYSYVSPGFPGDSRLALLFYAEAALQAGKDDRLALAIAAATREPALTEADSTPGENTILRSAALGDDSEIIEAMWGEPAEIAFSTEAEKWTYPEIMAQALFLPVTRLDGETGLSAGITQVAAALEIWPASPISFHGDLRTGDALEAFEKVLGAPAYRADDCLVYFYDGIRVKLRAAKDGAVSSFFVCF